VYYQGKVHILRATRHAPALNSQATDEAELPSVVAAEAFNFRSGQDGTVQADHGCFLRR
jgi:hypothetical protein